MMVSPTPLSLRRRLRRRFNRLPIATHVSHVCTVWVRREGRLLCKVCGKP